jgi:hypothetical protein
MSGISPQQKKILKKRKKREKEKKGASIEKEKGETSYEEASC